MLMTGKSFLRLWDMSFAWRNYAKAMNRKRPGTALGQNGFGYYVKKRTMTYISLKGSAIFGQMQDNKFCVSHFAPASHRDMVELLQKLAKDELKTVFAVTEDMVGMLEKLGFKNQNYQHPTVFRGECVMKHILTNF